MLRQTRTTAETQCCAKGVLGVYYLLRRTDSLCNQSPIWI